MPSPPPRVLYAASTPLLVRRMALATRASASAQSYRAGVCWLQDWNWKKVWPMTGLTHREYAGLSPDLFTWLEGPFVAPRPVAAQAMRMEECVANGRYVVRAELPGVDPAKDMEVSVAKGILTIRAERHEDLQGQHRSEFRYGTFSRHLPLPVTADANDMKASYHWGILQVSIGLHDADDGRTGRRIPVQTTAP